MERRDTQNKQTEENYASENAKNASIQSIKQTEEEDYASENTKNASIQSNDPTEEEDYGCKDAKNAPTQTKACGPTKNPVFIQKVDV